MLSYSTTRTSKACSVWLWVWALVLLKLHRCCRVLNEQWSPGRCSSGCIYRTKAWLESRDYTVQKAFLLLFSLSLKGFPISKFSQHLWNLHLVRIFLLNAMLEFSSCSRYMYLHLLSGGELIFLK